MVTFPSLSGDSGELMTKTMPTSHEKNFTGLKTEGKAFGCRAQFY